MIVSSNARKQYGLAASAAALALLMMPSGGLAASENAAKTAPSFVSADSALTLCNSPGFPPLSYFENPGDEKPIGMDIDLANELAKSWGVELRLMAGEFAGLLPALESGRCDMVMSGILLTDERQLKFDAVPYMKTSTLLLVAANNGEISDLESLSGGTLAIEAGTVLEKIAEEANKKLKEAGRPEIHVQTYPKAQDCIEQVLVGRSDATLVQDTEAAFRDKQMPGKLKTVYVIPQEKKFAIYMQKRPGDAAAVKAALDSLKSSGFLEGLLVKWHLPASASDLNP